MYSLLSKLLHAMSGLLILVLLPVGIAMTQLDYYNPWYQILPNIHYILGLIFGCIFLIRLSNTYLFDRQRIHPQLLVRVGHLLLYLFMAAAFISGYLLASDDLFFLPATKQWLNLNESTLHNSHMLFTYGLLILIIGHISMALWHQLVKKQPILSKMFR